MANRRIQRIGSGLIPRATAPRSLACIHQAPLLRTHMAEPSSLIHRYQQIADISGKMLKLAQSNDWDAVIALSQQYFEAVETLRPLQPLDTDDRLERKSLLSKILNDDARIRNLAAPEMARLGAMLGAMKRHQSVLEAYCNNSPERH